MTEQDPRVITALNGTPKTTLTSFVEKISVEDKSDTPAKTVEPEVKIREEVTEEVKQPEAEQETLYEVQGKKVPLKELLDNFETRENIHRRFTEADVKEKKLQAREEAIRKERDELAVINEKFDEMQKAVLDGNPLEALQIAMLMAQQGSDSPDNNAVLKSLVEQAVKLADTYHEMDDDARQVFFDKETVARKEKELKKKEAKLETDNKNKQLETHYNKVLDLHKIQDSELDAAYEDIQKLPKFKEELDKRDQLDKINYCASWVLGKRLRSNVEQGIKSLTPGQETDSDLVLALIEVVEPNCTIDDVKEVYKNYLKIASGKSVEDETEAPKKDAAPKAATPDRTPTEQPKAEKEEKPVVITSWKDLVAKHSAR